MYIKTDEINNGCDYLTAGKVYEAVSNYYDCYHIYDDDRDKIDFPDLSSLYIVDYHTNSHWYECDEHGNKLPSIDHYQSDTEQVTITLSRGDKDALERVLEALKGS